MLLVLFDTGMIEKLTLRLKSMKIQTMPKSFTQKDGTIWEWMETPELTEYIRQAQSRTALENLNEGPKRAS